MFHSGDEFEARARAARHQELRQLSGALASFLFGHRTRKKHTIAVAANSQDLTHDAVVVDFHRAA